MSIGSALGVTPTKDRETNLVEDRAMASALAAAKRLNSARKTGNPPYAPSRRSSIEMMRRTEDILDETEESGDDSGDDPPSAGGSDPEGAGDAGEQCEPAVTEGATVSATKTRPRASEPTKPTPTNPKASIQANYGPGTLDTQFGRLALYTPPSREEDAAGSAGGGGESKIDDDSGDGTSVIVTPDRPDEAPDTADRAFIKGSDEASSMGDLSPSESEYDPSLSDPEDPDGDLPDYDLGWSARDMKRARQLSREETATGDEPKPADRLSPSPSRVRNAERAARRAARKKEKEARRTARDMRRKQRAKERRRRAAERQRRQAEREAARLARQRARDKRRARRSSRKKGKGKGARKTPMKTYRSPKTPTRPAKRALPHHKPGGSSPSSSPSSSSSTSTSSSESSLSDDSTSSSESEEEEDTDTSEDESEDESAEEEEEGVPEGWRGVAPTATVAPPAVAVVYGNAPKNATKNPWLKHADEDSKTTFRAKYLKYVTKHDNDQRSVPLPYRTHPKAVVECIEPYTLWYICMFELPKEFRTDKPETADALAVHKWVMTKGKKELEMDSKEGIKLLRALKCEIDGKDGIKNVQTLIIEVHKLQVQYRLKTSQKQIVYWLTSGLSPPDVKQTVLNIQKQGTDKGKRASKKLKSFYNVLKKIAEKFKVAYDLGLKAPPKKSGDGNNDRKGGGGAGGGRSQQRGNGTQPRNGGRNNSNNNNRSSGRDKGQNGDEPTHRNRRGNPNNQEDRGERNRNQRGNSRNNSNNRSRGDTPKWKKGACYNCGGDHFVTECPTVPADRKNWSFNQWRTHIKKEKGLNQPSDKNDGRTTSSDNSDPGGRKRAVTKAEPEDTPGDKKSVTVQDGEDCHEGSNADGEALVGNVEGFYTCDGGCDRATVTHVFADAIIQKGGEYTKYDKPLMATLANGETKPIVTGFLKADMELVTPAGKVILPNWHIDVMEGPSEDFLLYMGQKEERALNLKSYKDQLTELAARHNSGAKRSKRITCDGTCAHESTVMQVKHEGKATRVIFHPGEQPRFKRRLATAPARTGMAPDVHSDGQLHVGKNGWEVGQGVKYLLEPKAKESYITTAAVKGQELSLEGGPGKVKVNCLDLEPGVKKWLGNNKATYQHRIRTELYILPNGQRDVVGKLTILKPVVLRVVESPVAAVILGNPESNTLIERRYEDLEMATNSTGNEEKDIDHRLDEMVEAARRAGMTNDGIRASEKMIRKQFRHIWRMTLGPDDYANVPPMKIELKGDVFNLPKPYMRRYTPAEIKWWREKMALHVKNGIFRPTNSGNLSPSNLIKKILNGEVLPDDFRMVVDLRELNKIIKDLDFPLPKLDEIIHLLHGAKFFAKADNTKGYWQFMLEEASKRLTAFVCPVGSYEHNRVPMGLKTAAAYYQRALQRVLEPLLYIHILQYIDDTLLYASTEEELLQCLEKYFTLMSEYNIKLHPGKFVLFAKKLTWGGKEISAEGTRPNPERIQSITELPEPTTVAELMNFVYGVAWFRGHIPYFAETAAPLYDIMKNSMERFKKKTSTNAKKILLENVPEWATAGRKAFQDVKDSMVNAVTTAYFDPNKKTCVFADANDDNWCIVVTQCTPGDERLPWAEQVGKHTLLALESGRFRHAQKRWHTVDKEGFCFGVKLMDYAHWINGGRHPAALFTDHKNLLAFFSESARPATCTKPNRERLTRWGLRLRGLRYEIHHIDGDENRLADLGTRWGNRFAEKKSTEEGLSGGPKPLMLRALRTKPPPVSDELHFPDIDIGNHGLLPQNAFTVTREQIAEVQRDHASTRPRGLRKSRETPRLWVTRQRKIWVPDGATQLKRTLYALAHQGIAGHRGQKATLANLQQQFHWDGMKRETEGWRRQCLQCLKLATGDTVPRPLGSQLMAERPGEIISADYIKMGTAKSGYKYVLMIVCRFSRLVMFFPTAAPTAIFAARALVRWSSLHGLPQWLITDGGSHFKNDLLKEFTQMLGIEHHITLAYCPWANGSVEVVGKDLLWTCRSLTSEFRASVDEWDLVLPVVELVINARKRDVLGGRSAVEIMTNNQPASTINLAIWSGVKMKTARKMVAKTSLVERHCAKLQRSLQRLHEAVADLTEAKRRRKALRAADKPGLRFNVGDYIMVPAEDTQANPVRPSKLNVHWQGPYEVVRANSATEYDVRLIGDTDTATVHWRKMRRIAGSAYTPTEEDIASALHDRQKFFVDKFVDWLVDDGEVELFVHWRHHGDEARTWEPLLQLTEDVPVLVDKYVKAVGNATLTQAHQDCLAMIAADPDSAVTPDNTAVTTASQRAAERTRAQRETTQTLNGPSAATQSRPTTRAQRRQAAADAAAARQAAAAQRTRDQINDRDRRAARRAAATAP